MARAGQVRRNPRFPAAEAWIVAEKVQSFLRPLSVAFPTGEMLRRRPEVEAVEFIVLPTEKGMETLDRVLRASGYSGDPKRRVYRKTVGGIPVALYAAHEPEEVGTMSLMFAGDHLFTMEMMAKAKREGYRLDPYGIWKGRKLVFQNADEREVFDFLGTDWVWPEDRSVARRRELEKMARKVLALDDIEPGLRKTVERARDAARNSVMPRMADEEVLAYVYQTRFGNREIKITALGASELLELGVTHGPADQDGDHVELPFEDHHGLWQALYEASTGRDGEIEGLGVLVLGNQIQIWGAATESGMPAYYAVYTGEMPPSLVGWSAEDFLTRYALWALEEPSQQRWLGPFATLPRA